VNQPNQVKPTLLSLLFWNGLSGVSCFHCWQAIPLASIFGGECSPTTLVAVTISYFSSGILGNPLYLLYCRNRWASRWSMVAFIQKAHGCIFFCFAIKAQAAQLAISNRPRRLDDKQSMRQRREAGTCLGWPMKLTRNRGSTKAE
jgi:hypothetical protein